MCRKNCSAVLSSGASKRRAVGEHEVFGFVEHEIFLVEHVGERDVGGEAHLLFQAQKRNVVGTAAAAQFQLTVLAHWPAGHPHARRATQRLHLPNEHQWLIIPVVLREAGRKIRDAVAAVGGINLGAQHVGIGQVILARSEFQALGGPNAEFAALLVIQQIAKNKAAVEARPAQPAHRRIGADEAQKGAVANQAQVVGMFRHKGSYKVGGGNYCAPRPLS